MDKGLKEETVLLEVETFPLPPVLEVAGRAKLPVRWPAKADHLGRGVQRPAQGGVHVRPVCSGRLADVIHAPAAPALPVGADDLHATVPRTPRTPAAAQRHPHAAPAARRLLGGVLRGVLGTRPLRNHGRRMSSWALLYDRTHSLTRSHPPSLPQPLPSSTRWVGPPVRVGGYPLSFVGWLGWALGLSALPPPRNQTSSENKTPKQDI